MEKLNTAFKTFNANSLQVGLCSINDNRLRKCSSPSPIYLKHFGFSPSIQDWLGFNLLSLTLSRVPSVTPLRARALLTASPAPLALASAHRRLCLRISRRSSVCPRPSKWSGKTSFTMPSKGRGSYKSWPHSDKYLICSRVHATL